MFKSRRIAWVLVFVTVVVLGSTAAWAAEKSKEKVAVVDGSKLQNAPRIKQYMDEVQTFRDQLDAKLKIRYMHTMLNDDEINNLIDLSTKLNPTQADKDQITALENKDKSRNTELATLQQVSNPTDQQKARLKELMDLQQKSKDTGEATEKDYEGQVQDKLSEVSGKIEQDVDNAVSEVAREGGYTLVLNKAAVLYGGVDITDKVINKLGRKAESK